MTIQRCCRAFMRWPPSSSGRVWFGTRLRLRRPAGQEEGGSPTALPAQGLILGSGAPFYLKFVGIATADFLLDSPCTLVAQMPRFGPWMVNCGLVLLLLY